MARLFIALLIVGVVIAAALIVIGYVAARSEPSAAGADSTPRTFRTIAYVLLLLLMLGVTLGWLGGV